MMADKTWRIIVAMSRGMTMRFNECRVVNVSYCFSRRDWLPKSEDEDGGAMIVRPPLVETEVSRLFGFARVAVEGKVSEETPMRIGRKGEGHFSIKPLQKVRKSSAISSNGP